MECKYSNNKRQRMISIISVLSLTREQGQIEGLKKKFLKEII
ncbi:hypothetical protein BH24BAC1_BH24BAC1_01090 [soil metagenome]